MPWRDLVARPAQSQYECLGAPETGQPVRLDSHRATDPLRRSRSQPGRCNLLL